MMSSRRNLPNILVTGTPGTGKSTLCAELCERTNLEYINVGAVAEANELYLEYDPEFQCHVIDEDKLLCELEDKMQEGGKVVDYHGCDLFPEEWFDIVFVLGTDNTLLYDRLVKKGYNGKKLENNIQCEIFQTLFDEAKEAYNPNIVHKLNSNTPDDMELNLEQICEWVKLYMVEHGSL